MRKRKTKVIVTLAIVGLVASVVGLLLFREPANEPKYGGHSLSYWVEAYGSQLYGKGEP